MLKLRGLSGDEYRFLGPSEPVAHESPLNFEDSRFAYSFLAALSLDPLNLAALRNVAFDLSLDTPTSGLGDFELLQLLAECLVSRRIRVVAIAEERVVVLDRTAPGEEDEEEETATVPPLQDELTWIKFRVLEEETGKPVAGVELTIRLPDGSTRKGTTDGSGTIEISGVPSGSCAIERMVDSQALEVVSVT